MDCIKFTVYGEQSHKDGRVDQSEMEKVYMCDPAKSKHFKQYAALVASQHRPKSIITGLSQWMSKCTVLCRSRFQTHQRRKKKLKKVFYGRLQSQTLIMM